MIQTIIEEPMPPQPPPSVTRLPPPPMEMFTRQIEMVAPPRFQEYVEYDVGQVPYSVAPYSFQMVASPPPPVMRSPAAQVVAAPPPLPRPPVGVRWIAVPTEFPYEEFNWASWNEWWNSQAPQQQYRPAMGYVQFGFNASFIFALSVFQHNCFTSICTCV